MDFFKGLLATALVACFGWIFTTNSKVNVTDQRVDDLKEFINDKFSDVQARLNRIENLVIKNGHQAEQ